MSIETGVNGHDPRSLPLFESRARQSRSTAPDAEPVPQSDRPGRVRSTFSWTPNGTGRPAPLLHAAPVDVPVAASGILRADRLVVDWALVAALRTQASELLTKSLGEERSRTSRDDQEALGRSIILELLESAAAEAVTAGEPTWTAAEQDALAVSVFNALFRMGRLQPLLEDEAVENIIITGFDRVWLELADGTLTEGPPVADSDQELIDFLVFLASRSEVNARPFSEAQPRLHLRLDDGSRLAATAWVNPRPSVVIRRHRLTRVTLGDLVRRGSLTSVAASFLRAAIRARLSIVVSGAQGFGKTTMARALCAEFDRLEAIATFETEYELGLHEMPDRHAIVHAWEARTGSGERGADGRMAGEFSIAEALFDSFRFNVSRQIVGEIRGPEVWPMIKAMESGSGSVSTTHGADADAAMQKLITCAMESGAHISHELATQTGPDDRPDRPAGHGP